MTGKIYIENYEGKHVECKRCTSCDASLPLSMFEKRPNVPIGVSSHCKKCIAKRKLARWHKNKNKLVAKSREWRMKNKEKVNGYVKKWRNRNPQKAQAIVARHRRKYPHKRSAQAAVEFAVVTRKITPQPCVVCKKLYAIETKAHAHHCDYAKKLDVMYLCPAHHKVWHRIFIAENA